MQPPASWSLSYGPGTEPTLWTAIDAGVVTDGCDTLSGSLQTHTLPENTYTFKLIVTDGAGTVREDRTLFIVDHSPPRFTVPLEVGIRWYDAETAVFLQWQTDDRTTGTITIRDNSAAGEDPLLTVPLGTEDTDHLADITSLLPVSGTYRASVTATNRSGQSISSEDVIFEYTGYSIARSGFRQVGALPPGIIMQGTSDFNGNGIPEIALKPASEPTYGRTVFHERAGTGDFVQVYQTTVSMRPSAVCDIDSDGKLDLIGYRVAGTATFHVAIASPSGTTGSPDVEWWNAPNVLAPTVHDLNGNGQPELVVLNDADRTELLVFTTATPGQLSHTATIRVPDSADGDFGIWRTACDRDGDGQTELVAGTTEGDVISYHLGTDNTVTVVDIIHGSHDATRVWSSTDLTGDGKDDIAVLRHTELDEFNLDTWVFTLELYGNESTPHSTLVFCDPRPKETEFFSGSIAPDGRQALAVAFAPRMYLCSVSNAGELEPVWYSDADEDCRPFVGDVTSDGRPDLLYMTNDSVRILERDITITTPEPPDSVHARPVDAHTVEVTWEVVQGLSYRVWTGSTAANLTPAGSGYMTSPYRITELQEGSAIYVAAQTIDRSRTDSVGVLCSPVSATPQLGPVAVGAEIVGDGQVFVSFNEPLDLSEVDVSSFRAYTGGIEYLAGSVIIDHSERRVLVSFQTGVFQPGDGAAVQIEYHVRGTTGAEGQASLAATDPGEPERPGIAYAYRESAGTVVMGFTHPVQESSISSSSVTVVGSGISSIARRADGSFTVTISNTPPDDAVVILTVTDAVTETGTVFSAGSVISPALPAGNDGEMLAVVQQTSNELWLVLDKPLDFDRVEQNDVLIRPDMSVAAVSQGPTDAVLIVLLDAQISSWRWGEEYQANLYARFEDGSDKIVQHSFTPMSDRPLTGHLLRADVISDTNVRLVFDTELAASAAPAEAIRVEPDIRITDISIQDSLLHIELDPATRLGPWGITYYVRVDSLLTADGNPMYESYPLTINPVTAIDSVRVFPQPYRPAMDEHLVFGGIPLGMKLHIYSIDGALVQRFEDIDTGGVLWNGRNMAGNLISSGVYFYIIEGPTGTRRGRFAVVR